MSERIVRRQAVVATMLGSMLEGSFVVGYLAYLIAATGSVAAANAVGSSFWIAMAVAELPTGYVADRLGPRAAVALSCLVRAVAFVLFFLGAHSVALVVVANAVAGVAVTVSTGATSAQVQLASRRHALTIDYLKLSSQQGAMQHAGLVLGALINLLTLRFAPLPVMWLVATGLAVVQAIYVLATWEPLRGSVHATPVGHLVRSCRKITSNAELLRGWSDRPHPLGVLGQLDREFGWWFTSRSLRPRRCV